uniref:EGF-like domain-containing protein n=1 Tax=Meloidogyne floridensis TaxID=298350 RepID=A0A915P0K2_9BILA
VSNEAVADVPEKLPVRLSYQEMTNPQQQQQSPQLSPLLSPSIGGGQQSAASPSIINNSPPNLLPTQIFEVCTSNDCNGHGSCLGFRSAPFCSCNSGYLGFKCEDTACDNNLHCSGRGSCIGSVNQHFCFCNIGYSGSQCQTQLR